MESEDYGPRVRLDLDRDAALIPTIDTMERANYDAETLSPPTTMDLGSSEVISVEDNDMMTDLSASEGRLPDLSQVGSYGVRQKFIFYSGNRLQYEAYYI